MLEKNAEISYYENKMLVGGRFIINESLKHAFTRFVQTDSFKNEFVFMYCMHH